MPRYFFNIHDGTNFFDCEGTVLPDDAQARADAVNLAGNAIIERGDAFWITPQDWSLKVSNEAGEVLCELRLATIEHRL
jgi:hypothetical protein